MTRTQIQQVLVIVLLIAFGAVWATTRKGPLPGPAPAETAPAAETAPRTKEPEAATSPAELEGPVASEVRDLFRLPARLLEKIRERERALQLEQAQQLQPPSQPPPPAEPPPELPSLELQGIFWGAGRPQAIINRRIVSVGDTMERARVVAITKEGVTLAYGERQVQLKPSTEIRSGDSGSGQGGPYTGER